jgi:hypothetical protein
MEKQEAVIEVAEVDKELEDILENEVKYDSDGVARGSSPGRCPSVTGSVGSVGSNGSKKRRTWKKPKDKPKRPLSAYNLFFKHERSRIVEGKSDDPPADEIIRSIEGILSTSRETRRHRKTHGRISFGDLARKIAEKWKAIGVEQKAVFEHYAELDMRRYRKEVKIWKDKKDLEALAANSTGNPKQGSTHENTNSMNNSFSSLDSESEFSLDHVNANSISSSDAWAPRKNYYDSMNSSFSSSCSVDSEFSLEPLPIGQMVRNVRPNMHASMPNVGGPILDRGIPGFVQGEFQANTSLQNLEQPMQHQQFGQHSLSTMHIGAQQGVQMDGLNASFDHMQMQQVNSNSLQQMQQQNSLQQMQQQNFLPQMQQHNSIQQLQRSSTLEQQRQQLLLQQQLLQQQQQQLQRQIQMQQHSSMQQDPMQHPMQRNFSDPIPFEQVFPNETTSGQGGGDQLENFLSNLDLSNM